ncbi:hypothetical protein DD598_28860 [Enterobacter cloacae complex sp. 2DZ2F16B1]|nr:hypothetical protein DD598_28860 [Enterobacter cloacae complex sp. 2DZ2F16B1]
MERPLVKKQTNERVKPRPPNRYALLATLPEWEDSELADSIGQDSEEHDGTGSRLEDQVNKADRATAIDLTKASYNVIIINI